jgi:hypothetical protein
VLADAGYWSVENLNVDTAGITSLISPGRYQVVCVNAS